MFKRFTVIVIVIFILSFLSLSLSWQDTPGVELSSNIPEIQAYRMVQDLGGKWSSYPTLRQAWTQEERMLNDEENSIAGLIKGDSFVLPSTRGFRVAAKQFNVTGKWGYKTPRLVIKGVYGKVRVFLNGINDVNFLGEVEGNGGVASIDFSPARFDYSKANIVFFEMSENTIQKNKMLGWLWPEQGRITGQINLEAVSETTIDTSKITVTYDSTRKQIKTGVTLIHHQMLDKGPWVITGVLKIEGQKVAECLLPLTSDGQDEQTIGLLFNLPRIHSWSIEDPFLYELDLTVADNNGEYESVQIPVGFRNVSSSEGKWVVNSKEMTMKGIILTQAQEYKIRNQHQVESFVTSVKAKGDNIVYFMGFFPDEEWLYAADRLGIGIWLEFPLSVVAKTKIPDPLIFEELVLISEKHPSVLAWTAAKGLEPSTISTEYLDKAMKRVAPLSVYQLVFTKDRMVSSETEALVILPGGLQGEWGHLDYYSDVASNNGEAGADGWKNEKAAAISWLVWLILLSIQNFRAINWNYNELFNSNPKRAIRRAFFWSSLALVSRMGTIGAVLISLLFKIPSTMSPWLSYDAEWICAVQNQSPLLLWVLISSFLVAFRLMQVGIAVSAFPQRPDSLGLACWLEKKYLWTIFVGIAWVLMTLGFPNYLPIGVYVLLSLLFFPFRIRDTLKIKGKYYYLWVVPITILTGALLLLIFYHQDFLYLGKMILPLIDLKEVFLNNNFFPAKMPL